MNVEKIPPSPSPLSEFSLDQMLLCEGEAKVVSLHVDYGVQIIYITRDRRSTIARVHARLSTEINQSNFLCLLVEKTTKNEFIKAKPLLLLF